MESKQQRNICHLAIVYFLLSSTSPAADGQIRLAGSGSTRCSGRVEIYYNNTWGTVCDDDWDLNDTEVVCRELGCGTALSAPYSARFGEGTGQIWLDDVACSGSERSVTLCQHRGFGTHNCKHGEDAGVVCSALLPKPSISMNPAAEVTWGQNVSITCSVSTQTQQILSPTFILKKASSSVEKTQTSSTNSATFNMPEVNFDNEGSYLCQYKITVAGQDFTSSSDSVSLSVTVPLQQPNISLTSPNRGLVWGPEGAQITRGFSFVFTCSTSSHYPGGVFHLIFSGSNLTNTEPVVNQSASFSFPVAEYEHRGNYSCVYEVTLSSRRFTSTQTAPISVVIKMHLLLLVSSVAAGGLLLLLLVLVVVCLVCKRRRRAKHTGAVVQTQLAVRVRNAYGDTEYEDDKADYENVDPMDTKKKLKEEAGKGEEEETNDYVEPEIDVNFVNFSVEENEEEEEEEEDNEDDYENVTKPFG